MTQFLKNHAKIIYIIFGIFSFFFIVAACFYITQYNNTAVVYDMDVLTGDKQAYSAGNPDLNTFCIETNLGFVDVYQALFQFNRQLQKGNNMYLALGVVSLVMLACMLICSNHSRKKFYISNLISGVVCPSVSIIVAIVALVLNFAPLSKLSQNYDLINWGALGNTSDRKKAVEWYLAGDTSHFSIDSTSLVVFGIFIILFIVVCGLLIAYNVYRYLLTQKELNNVEKVVEENA